MRINEDSKEPKPGKQHSSDLPDMSGCQGVYHAHGHESGPEYDDENFSYEDLQTGWEYDVPMYLGTPSEKLLCLEVKEFY